MIIRHEYSHPMRMAFFLAREILSGILFIGKVAVSGRRDDKSALVMFDGVIGREYDLDEGLRQIREHYHNKNQEFVCWIYEGEVDYQYEPKTYEILHHQEKNDPCSFENWRLITIRTSTEGDVQLKITHENMADIGQISKDRPVDERGLIDYIFNSNIMPKRSPSMIPEHEKLAKVKEKSQAVGEFLEWLNREGIHLCTLQDNKWGLISNSTSDILAQYFGIDEQKLEEEKLEILDEMRKLNEPKTT